MGVLRGQIRENIEKKISQQCLNDITVEEEKVKFSYVSNYSENDRYRRKRYRSVSSSKSRTPRRRRYRSRSRSMDRTKKYRRSYDRHSEKDSKISEIVKAIEADALGLTKKIDIPKPENKASVVVFNNLSKKEVLTVKEEKKKKRKEKIEKLKKWKERQRKEGSKEESSGLEFQTKSSTKAPKQSKKNQSKLKDSIFLENDASNQKRLKLKFNLSSFDNPMVSSSNQINTSEFDGEDPLDAFMTQLKDTDAVKNSTDIKKKTISFEDILDQTENESQAEEENEKGTDFIEALKKCKQQNEGDLFSKSEVEAYDDSQSIKNRDNDIELFDSDDGGQADAFNNFGQVTIAPASFIETFNTKKVRKKYIPVIAHDKVIYKTFTKNFYKETDYIKNLEKEQVASRRFADSIKVKGLSLQNPIELWSETGLNSVILQMLEVNGWKKPFAIQKQSLPVVMSGRDLLAVANTGSGKTLSFVLPLLRHVQDQVQRRNLLETKQWLKQPDSHLYKDIQQTCFESLRMFLKFKEINETCIRKFEELLVKAETDFKDVRNYFDHFYTVLSKDSKRLSDIESSFINALAKDYGMEELLKNLSIFDKNKAKLTKYFSKLTTSNGPIGLILAPSRELAKQLENVIGLFTRVLNLNSLCCAGGDDTQTQIHFLSKAKLSERAPVDILVGTPGRIIDLMCLNKGTLLNMTSVTFLVLDEADRMFDVGFAQQIERILLNLNPKHQTVLFSATFPQNVQRLARKLLRFEPCEIIVGGKTTASELITQKIDLIEQGSKVEKLLEVLGQFYQDNPDDSALIFANKHETCDELYKKLINFGYNCFSLHGNQNQADRDDTIERFKAKEEQLLIATSVAGRGLDVPHIKLVLNYDCPNHIEDYIHRIGRTGRANTSGLAHTFLTPEEEQYSLDLVRALTGSNQRVPEDLQQMANGYREKIRKGEAKFRRSGYTGNSGFTFKADEKTEMEKELEYIKKKVKKDIYGIEISDDEDDEPFDKAAATAKAREVAASLSSQYRGAVSRTQRKNEYTKQLEDIFMSAIPINDFPQSVRSRITSRGILDPIQNSTGCSITSRGRYIEANKKVTVGAQPLHLYLEATSEFSVKNAQQELEDILQVEASSAVDLQGPGKFSMVFG